MAVRRPASFLLTAAFFVPSLASAVESQPGVAILDVRAQGSVTSEQALVVRQSVATGLAAFRVRPAEDHPAVIAAHGPGAEVSATASLVQARAHAKEGKKLLDDLDQAGAEGNLRQAADLFEANAGALSSPADLIGTYLLLARVFFATEREVLARDIFRRVVQLQPDLALDRAIYPPGMVTIFDDVKKTILASPLGSMSVAAVPSPAKVFLDGRERGATPLDLVNLVAGVHTLTVRRAGFAPWVRPVDVTTFRVDKIVAELVLDRHPALDLAFVPKGTEQKDSTGLALDDYLDAVASAASLDVVLLGRLSKSGGRNVLELRAYRPTGHAWAPIQKFTFSGAPPASFDKPVGEVLAQAAQAGWIPSISARRNVSAGGGALDETARFDFRASLVPGARLAGKGRNFPNAPSAGLRLTLDYRLGPRLLLTGETGFDMLMQSNVVLKDSAGNVVASGAANVQSVYTSIPLDLGVRYYFGVSTIAPFAVGGAGLRYDQLAFNESLKFDRIRGSSGIGVDAFAGGGFDYALGLKSGIFAEARLHAGTIGVGDAVLHTQSTPPSPDRKLPVKPGLYTGLRLYVGYLRVF